MASIDTMDFFRTIAADLDSLSVQLKSPDTLDAAEEKVNNMKAKVKKELSRMAREALEDDVQQDPVADKETEGGSDSGSSASEGLASGNSASPPVQELPPQTSTALVPQRPTDEENRLRRLSLVMGEAFVPLSVIIAGSLGSISITVIIDKAMLVELVESYIGVIKLSSRDVRGEMELWFDTNFPSWEVSSGDEGEHDAGNAAMKNVRTILVELAVKLRPMVKMFRIGLGVRLFAIAASSYVDMATDVLVLIAFLRTPGQKGWGMASLACVSAGVGFQAFVAWLQYRGFGFRKWGPMVVAAFFGVLPLIEAWSVFRGAEQVEGMIVDPITMLATTKSCEIVFESLPETIIQTIFILSSKPEDLSPINYFSIISSIVAAAMIWTDGNIGLARSLFVGAPKNPGYNWLPMDKTDFNKCFGGFFLFTMAYFTSNAFALTLAYFKFGGNALLYAVLTELAIVMLFKHFADGELFAFSLAPKPSKVDYILGPLIKLCFYLVNFVGYFCNSKSPWELGPHVTSGLIIWRMLTSSALVVLTLPSLVNDEKLPWLSVTGGMPLYFSCLILSWVGAAIFFGNMAEEHERWRWWRRQTFGSSTLKNVGMQRRFGQLVAKRKTTKWLRVGS